MQCMFIGMQDNCTKNVMSNISMSHPCTYPPYLYDDHFLPLTQ